MMADNELWLGILGPLQLSVGDASLPLGTPKQRVILAMLVIHRNRPVTIDSLIEAAWEHHQPAGARATVHTYVSNLRRLVSTAGVNPRTLFVSAPSGYRLSVADSQVDLPCFITEKNAGLQAAAAGRFVQASRHLSAALALWRGPVLDELHEFGFVNTFATALIEDKIIAHTVRAEAEIACGRASSVISELEELVVEHPFHEALWRQLITAYYVCERQSDALNAYRRLKTSLGEELGIDPGPKVIAVYERVLRQQPLDIKNGVRAAAEETIQAVEHPAGMTEGSAPGALRDAAGHRYPLVGTVTRIGRSPGNDIVFDDSKVSRQHAVIVDTGSSFVITDLRSANGVYVLGQRIHTSAPLNHGDAIDLGENKFTFEVFPRLG